MLVKLDNHFLTARTRVENNGIGWPEETRFYANSELPASCSIDFSETNVKYTPKTLQVLNMFLSCNLVSKLITLPGSSNYWKERRHVNLTMLTMQLVVGMLFVKKRKLAIAYFANNI
ncbi:hypothetical protein V6Z12_D03G054800 [Gossypium hirsutum]